MPLDPQVARYLDETAALGQPPPWEAGPIEARRLVEERAPLLGGPPEEVGSIEDRILETPEGSVPVRIYRPFAPPAEALPALLWYHGGGWVVGSLDTHEVPCRALANRAGCVVVAVDYRMAPEHPYPAAVADSWTALLWVFEHAGEIGVDPARLAVGGDSAGGNLAAVMTLRAAERGHPELVAQLLIYPVTDVDLGTESYRLNGSGYGLSRDLMRWYIEQYAPDAITHRDEALAPLKAMSVHGLPPALVVTCEFDPLLAEGEAYARRLADAGVPTTLLREEGMIHGYFRWAGVTDRAAKTYDDCAAVLRRAFGTG
jgi:acetyl esterase